MLILTAPAGDGLRGLVKGFRQRVADLGDVEVVVPLPARPDQFLEFYLAEPFQVSVEGRDAVPTPAAVLVGPQSRRRITLHLKRRIEAFTVHFEPGAMHRLFGLNMSNLADDAVPIRDVLGSPAGELEDRIAEARDFEGRVLAARQWLHAAMLRARPDDPVAQGARLMDRAKGRVRIDRLAARAGLSPRQFSRRFSESAGLPPKVYGRTVRLNAVIAARQAEPWREWADLALEAGYFDQAHMIRDFRALANASPTLLLREIPVA